MQSLCAVSALVLLLSCGSSKPMVSESPVVIYNASCEIQKVFPGVSGPVVYFAQYSIHCSVETTSPVDFKHLIIDKDSLVIRSVRVDGRILNTNTGEQLTGNAQNVILEASKTVHQTEIGQTENAAILAPNTVSLTYLANGVERIFLISDIKRLNDEYRPAAHPGQRE